MKQVHELDRSNVNRIIEFDLTDKFIYIDKSKIGNTQKERLQWNVLAVARNSVELRKSLATLSSNGFFLVGHDRSTGISKFQKLEDYESFKSNFESWRNCSIFKNGLFYSLEEPVGVGAKHSCARLLVLFSSIADYPMNASVSRRAWFWNWLKCRNYLPQNTYILRIADIGATLAAFYSNTNFDNQFEIKIQNLIAHIICELDIPWENVILYGSSKGGSGALLHGILGGYQTVSVDPIVSDEYYLFKAAAPDFHFVDGCFPESKETKFIRLINEMQFSPFINIITSRNSQQYSYIRRICQPSKGMKFFTFDNASICCHADVSPKTIVFQTTLINSIFYNHSFESGRSFEF